MDQIKQLASYISGAEVEWLSPNLLMIDDDVNNKKMNLTLYYGQTVPMEPLLDKTNISFRKVADILVDTNASQELIKTTKLLRGKM
jgi:hypothetical protein